MKLGKYICVKESSVMQEFNWLDRKYNWIEIKEGTEVDLVELDDNLSNGVMRVFEKDNIRYTLCDKEFDVNFILI